MPKHITIGLFEASKTSRQTLAKKLQDLSKQYGLTKKIFTYVKNEGANLYHDNYLEINSKL
jgi:5-bromo-4-chloroindolyl phosphate hydrolysis protein